MQCSYHVYVYKINERVAYEYVLGTFGCGMLQDKCGVGQSYKIRAC